GLEGRDRERVSEGLPGALDPLAALAHECAGDRQTRRGHGQLPRPAVPLREIGESGGRGARAEPAEPPQLNALREPAVDPLDLLQQIAGGGAFLSSELYAAHARLPPLSLPFGAGRARRYSSRPRSSRAACPPTRPPPS